MPSMTIDRPFPEKVRRANYLLSCKWCIGGTVMRHMDGRRLCINCSREHDENGELITPRRIQPDREGRSLFKVR